APAEPARRSSPPRVSSTCIGMAPSAVLARRSVRSSNSSRVTASRHADRSWGGGRSSAVGARAAGSHPWAVKHPPGARRRWQGIVAHDFHTVAAEAAQVQRVEVLLHETQVGRFVHDTIITLTPVLAFDGVEYRAIPGSRRRARPRRFA